jgi:hypothetical protein
MDNSLLQNQSDAEEEDFSKKKIFRYISNR